MKTPKNTSCINASNIDEIEKKVRESRTYQTGFFVILTKIKKEGKTWNKFDQMIMSEPQSEEQCETDKARYEALIEMYGRRAGMKTTISIHNIFERYDLWQAGHGGEQPRAAQWQAIKDKARA